MAAEVISLVVSAEDKASNILGKVGGSLGGFGKALGIAAAGATAAAAAIFKVTQEGARFQDSMIKAAQRANMGVQEFSGLAHAAELAGINVDAMQQTLSKMNKAISDASYGVKTYKDQFQKLGITVTDTGGQVKTSSRILEELADKIHDTGVNADVMSAGMQIAGEQFAKMLPLLRQGSAGFRAAAEDARYLGIEVGEKAAKQAEYFNDSLTRLGKAFTGISVAVSNEVGPQLTGLIRIATDVVVKLRSTIAGWAGEFVKDAILVYAYAEQVFNNIKKLVTFSFSTKDVANWINSIIDSFPKVVQAAVVFAQALGNVLITAFKVIWQSFAELGKWGWQKMFDFITGQDLAGSFADVLTQRIPEATAESVSRIKTQLDELKVAAGDAGGTVATALMTAFGVSAEEAKRRAAEITAQLTSVGTIAQDTSNQETKNDQTNNKARLESRRAEIQEKLTLLDESLLGETERIQAEEEIRAINIQLARENNLIGEQEMDALLLAQKAQTQARLGDIIAGAEAARARVAKMTLQSQVQYTADSLGSITALMGSENKKQFAIGKAASIAQAIIQTYTAATNAYQSASAIPIVGWILGPIAAAAAVAFGLAQVSKIKSQQPPGGQAHAGLTNVPSEGSFLLDKGERVLMPEQNRDLTAFLDSQKATETTAEDTTGGTQPITQQFEIHILENATNADALISLPKHEWERIMTERMIPAMNTVGRMGVKPDYIERTSR